jgi:hypothetical protein
MTNVDGEKQKPDVPVMLLQPDDVPIGTPLEWPIIDTGGVLLFDRGAIILKAEDRTFLFQYFQPRRGSLDAQADLPSPDEGTAIQQDPPTISDLGLTIGMSLGLRPKAGVQRAMLGSKLIGLTPNGALFVMPPLPDDHLQSFRQDEQLEVVAISARAIFLFVCTVEAARTMPFSYLILSKPREIRRLRSRKSARSHVKLAVRYATALMGSDYAGLGVGSSLSPLGMSLATSIALGQVGDRLRVAFRIKTDEFNLDIEAVAYIRNVQKGEISDGLIVHGLEFDPLESAQQIALKCFILDHN